MYVFISNSYVNFFSKIFFPLKVNKKIKKEEASLNNHLVGDVLINSLLVMKSNENFQNAITQTPPIWTKDGTWARDDKHKSKTFVDHNSNQ